MVTSKNYLLGLVAMYLSLKSTGTQIPLYAMLPQRLVEDEARTIARLKRNGIKVLQYDHSVEIPQQLIEKNTNNGHFRFNHTFDKLLIFGLTQFEKIVFIDADMFILQNLDHLFTFPHMSAVAAGRSYPGNQDWIDLNSGLLTIQPQDNILHNLVQKIPEVIMQKDICGDQDILQLYYPDWPQQPEKKMEEKYGVFAQYASYYEKQLGYTYTNDIENPKSVAVIHFIGEKKPWMQHWSSLSVLKQELQLAALRLIGRRNTTAVLLEYKQLVRKARKMLYA
ncbi:MAG: hypothetical protein K6E96_01885 [Bacteroidales bacterium]|nr:hypothetical protein [Bacteroidales bacterium]